MLPTSLSLLERLRTRPDEGAGERLVTVYRPWIIRWLTRHGLAESDADDLGQEILMVVLASCRTFSTINGRERFVPGSGKSSCTVFRTSRAPSAYRPQPGGDSAFRESLNQLEDPASGLSRHWDHEHDRYVVRRLVALIEPDFQEVTWRAFRGVMLDGDSPAAVAARLGISVNAVLLAKSRHPGPVTSGRAGFARLGLSQFFRVHEVP